MRNYWAHLGEGETVARLANHSTLAAQYNSDWQGWIGRNRNRNRNRNAGASASLAFSSTVLDEYQSYHRC